MFDVKTIRQDFPILDQEVNGKPMVYLDSAATSQKPLKVIETLDDFYRRYNANVHRGIYKISEMASDAYEGARKKTARFINANSWREIIFTRNATESINLVAYSWGRKNLKAGDEILVSEMEHHANLVPWQMLAKETQARLKFIPVDEQGYLDMPAFYRLLTPSVKLVSVTQMSNVLGTVTPIMEIVKAAHQNGSLVMVDGAQAVPHMPTDVQAFDCDFMAFSGHKMLAPTGIGVLYGKKAILQEMPPFMTGGDMIRHVTLESADWNDLPWRFEAGTPAIAQAIGLGAAIDYLAALGMSQVRRHEIELLQYAFDRLGAIEGIHIYGPKEPTARGGAMAFTLGDIHPHDLASILDAEGIAIRAGHHCAMPLHEKLGISASARASFYIYNDKDDVDRLVLALEKALAIFGRP
jgi:cysteine desulfurase / selenocysteine lyase